MQPQSETSAQGYEFDPIILREYDIRGQVGKNLSTQDAYMLGRAFGTLIVRDGGKTVAVGYDGRETSPEMSEALIKGLSECGIDVTAIGLGPTPMLYFAVKHLKTDAGIMVTGSHNPSDYNGFKMTLQTKPVYGELIQKLGNIAAAGDFETAEGSVETQDIQDTYVARMLQDLTNQRPLKIAWDAGNGAAGEILRRLTAKLPGEHILLYDEIDGNFPNHHPDPTVDTNLRDLIQLVHDEGCDLGIAFDGDADRIGVVNEKGHILRCDSLMTIYARDILAEQPGATIIGDVKCSQIMFDEIARLGGEPVMWKTGHSLVKAKLAELNAPLAGELSGHIFFNDKYYGFDDALYCSVRLINALGDEATPLSTLTENLPQVYSTPEIRIEVDEAEKFDLVPKISAKIKESPNPDEDVNETDGIRVTTPHGWWLLRPSNTQNVLVARAEGNSPAALENLKAHIATLIESLGYTVEFPEQL